MKKSRSISSQVETALGAKSEHEEELLGFEARARESGTVLTLARQTLEVWEHEWLKPKQRIPRQVRASIIRLLKETRGRTDEQAERDYKMCEIASRPTFRFLYNAGFFLDKARKEYEAAVSAAPTADTYSEGIFGFLNRKLSADRSYAEAVNLAFFAGVFYGQFRAHDGFDRKSGSPERPPHTQNYSRLRKVTTAEFRRLSANGKCPTNAELRDAVASPQNKITYSDGHFTWTTEKGKKRKTADKTWYAIVTALRKSVLG